MTTLDPEFKGNQLPPFPVDDETLNMLEAAIRPREHGDPDATTSSVWPFLELMSQMGGSDTKAVAEQVDENIFVMRDQHYHDHDVLYALLQEVRRLRSEELRLSNIISRCDTCTWSLETPAFTSQEPTDA